MMLVTGASGNIGRELVAVLAGSGEPVRALVRDTRPASLPDAVTTVVGDLDEPLSLVEAVDGVRAVFVLPGFRDMPGVLRVIREAGVEHVVQLSGLSAGSGDRSNAITAYMIRSEEAVYESGVPWTIVRPAALMSNVLRWQSKLAAGDVVRLPFADVGAACVHPGDVAAVVAECLLGRGHVEQTYLPTGPETLTPRQQVAALGRVLGRPLRCEAQPDAEARAEMLMHTAVDYVDAFFDFYADGSLDESPVRSTVEDLTGREPRTFDEWATEHRGDLE